MTTVTVALSSVMQRQVAAGTNVYAWAVYAESSGSLNWTPLTGPSTQVTGLSGAGQKLYFILQSTDSSPGTGNSVKVLLQKESDINPAGTPTSADTLNYRYDSFEAAFTPSSTDTGNLTDVNGFGIPMAIEVGYGRLPASGTFVPTSSSTRGYNLSGSGIWDALASAGGSGSIQYFAPVSSGGYATTQPRMAISPATALGNGVSGTNYSSAQWDPYVSSLMSGSTASATTPGGGSQIQIAGYFNGAPDAGGVWHNAGFYAYSLTFSGGNFVLTPDPSSQIRGTITISPSDLANSIYLTLGNVTVTGLANGNGTANDATLTMNTGANNQWGAVLRDFVVGFTAGYWNASATSLNGQVTAPINLNKEWNQDPTYAFGGSVNSGPGSVTQAVGGFYDPYAKVFFDYTNSYGTGYADFLTRAFGVGPLINVSDGTGQNEDANQIIVTLFADSDATSGYSSQTIDNYLAPGTGGYVVPAGVNTNGIQTTLNFNIGTMSLKEGTPVTITLKGATAAQDVALPVISSFGNYGIVSNGSGGYATSAYGDAVNGVINIKDLPVTSVTSGTGVNWYQIQVGSGAAQKTFNYYQTVDSAGRILNPAYAGQAGAIAVDGLAAITGTGTGQYVSSGGSVTINFQNGGNNTLDPSLMAVVPLLPPPYSGAPPQAAYVQPTAPLVGMRPGYTSGAGAPFLGSYDVWTAQYTSNVSSTYGSGTPVSGSSASWTVPAAHTQTVYNGGLVFGWNGADSAAQQQQAAASNFYVASYTNKIAGGDIARLSFTLVSGAPLPSEIVANGGVLTATADSDGNWATITPVSFGNGTYTVQMQEFLASDSAFAQPLNSASAVQSFTVAQGAVVTSSLSVDSGQTSNGLAVGSGGAVTVSGGTANFTMISAGGSMQMAAGTGDSGSIVLGSHVIWVGATASDTTVALSGADYIYGTTSAASINGGGTQIVGGGGGATSATAINATLNSGGYQHVKSAGWASGTTVLSGGNQIVDSGGFAMGTIVNAGGTLHISGGGSAGSSYTISTGPASGQIAIAGGATVSGGGFIHVLDEGVTLGALLQGTSATANVWAGGSAASMTLQAGTYLNVYAGGYSVAATIQLGGTENVWGSGSIASNATVQSGGYEYVYSGGTAINTLLQSGGGQWVWGPGTTASNTTVLPGGTMVVHGGGVASDVTLNGGTAEVNSGGSGSININSAGSLVKVYQSAGDVSISGLTVSVGTIDFVNIAYTSGVTSATWTSAGAGAGSGTLTLTSGAVAATVTLFGNFMAASDFTYTAHGGGTRVTDTTSGTDIQNLLTPPNA